MPARRRAAAPRGATAPVVIASSVVPASGQAVSGSRAYPVTVASAAGDTRLVLVCANTSGTNAAYAGLTDSQGNTYIADGSYVTAPSSQFYRCEGATGGPGGGQSAALATTDTFTLACSATQNMNVGMIAVKVTGAGPADVADTEGYGASTSFATNVTPNAAHEVLITLAANQTSGGNPAYGAPFTLLQAATTGQIMSAAYLLDAGAQGPTTTCTATVGTACNGRIGTWALFAAPNVTGTGALAAKKVKLAGTGTVAAAGITGTGGLAAKKVALAGAGSYTFPAFTGTGSLRAKKVALAGAGTVTAPGGITGTGVFAAKKISLAGAGTYTPPIAPPPAVPLFVPAPTLLPVTWDGLSLNDGERGDGLCTVVTDVAGWYGSPPLNGGDLDRQLTDGAIFGFKTVGARVVTITGAAAADAVDYRAVINQFARDLAARAVRPQPADLVIAEDEGAGDGSVVLLSASVRADTSQLNVAWNGRLFFTYQVELTAADPRLYDSAWQSVTVSPAVAGGQTGRLYPWAPVRLYASADVANAARMVNGGSAPAPVQVTYYGDLGESRLTDGITTIHLAPLAAGQQIIVNSETLNAYAPGGTSRASYLMAGSAPLVIPPESNVQWSLYGTGGGHVTLAWRGVYA